jgi:hypothetical protein
MCYELEELRFEDPLLKTVATSYLITMVDSTRRAQYMQQLRAYRPTARVVVVHNQGYKRCRKRGVRTPAQDLWHANRHIARLARHEPFALVLEDDVQFTPAFVELAPEIDAFLKGRARARMAYSLGIQAFLCVPVDPHHLRAASGGFAHAVVYSNGALRQFGRLRLPSWGIHDVLVYSVLKTYAPRKACAVQRYTRTANARRWDVLRITDTLNRICRDDPCSLYTLYDRCNNAGGVVVVVGALALATAALRRP